MNSLNHFLNKLSNLGVNLWLEDISKSSVEELQLRYKAPKGIMTSALLSELKERKSDIIQFLQDNQNQDSTEQLIQPISRDGNLPLSFAQQRLWFIEQLEGSSATYNWPYNLHFKGSLNLPALKQSLTEIVRRHEALRTTFAIVNSTPVQKIHPPQPIELPILDLQSLPESEKEAEARQLITKEQNQPFDLVQGPLLRVMLIRLESDNHLLSLTMHHIVADGWFKSIFMRELTALYSAFCEGKPSPLEELTLQYADFAAWQREYFQGEVLQRHVNYWKQKLAGIPPLLELPIDRPRPTLQTFTGDKYDFYLNQHLTQQLKALSKKSGTTLFITLLTAFAVLLSRYSNQPDIVVGSPISNRNRSEIEKIIGFFVNTLALRIKLDDNPTFFELLTQVKQTALDAYEYQDLPFEKLVEELNPQRSLSHSPVFQTLFVLQNFPIPQFSISGLDISMLETEAANAKFDLILEVFEVTPELAKAIEYTREQGIENVLSGRFEYNTDLFDAATISRMAEHFQTLLEAIVTNPQQQVDQLPLLSVAEQEKLLVKWNNTNADYPDVCIHQLFEAQVAKTPDAVALKFEEQELTYLQLNEKANQLAHYLQSLGVKPDTLVGICIERSLSMVIGLLAILKAGGAYVPLDPSYPSERLEYMLDDSQVFILLTQDKLQASLPENSAQLICLDTDWDLIAQESTANPITEIQSHNLAYVIYTSGSTGKPKGVMNAHQGIVNRLLWMQAQYQLNEQERILQKTPFSFDVSVWEFFWTLSTGATLVIAKPEGHKDSVYLTKIIQTEQITTLHFVPSMLKVFLEAREVEQCQSLTRVICSGEELPKELENRFFKRLQCELHNLYGPTEAAIDVTAWQCQPESTQRIVPIGKPIANTQVYILDQNLKPVPIGVAGELHLGGVQVARGYLNRPELTEEKFIANPFEGGGETTTNSSPAPLLYKTGDLARYLPDGNIEYIGRIDNQVKIRGFRIELGEIESALAQYPDIEQSVVIVREDVPGDKRLVAYIVSPQTITIGDLRSYLKPKLPDYMIPGIFVQIEQMPLTPNGKIDRRALPQPEIDRSSLENAYVRPKTEIETKIAAVWQEVLKIDKVGIYDNFFDLGGHSLLIAQVQGKLTEILAEEIPILDMFIYPTINAFAEHLTDKPKAELTANRAKQRSLRKASMADKRKLRQMRRETHQS